MRPSLDNRTIATLFGPVVKATDCYGTPAAPVEALLATEAPPAGCTVLDPCAGNGAILRVLAAHGYQVEALEIRPECQEQLHAITPRVTIESWLTYGWRYSPRPDAIVTNPPFSIAPAIVGVSLGLDVPFVAMLLRANTLGSNSWRRLWAEKPPTRLRPVRRPSFDDSAVVAIRRCEANKEGGTDASEYLWILWVAGERPIDIKPI